MPTPSERMLDPFPDMNQVGDFAPFIEQNTSRIPKWINITGYGKKGKTAFIIRLMQYLRVLHFDFEDGTSLVDGWRGVKIQNMREFREKTAALSRVVQAQGPIPVIALDPFDALAEMAERDFVKANNLTDIGDLQYGEGYRRVREMIAGIIATYRPLCKMLITVTHLKYSALGTEERALSFYDMNLQGKIKQILIDQVDANLVFTQAVDSERQVPYLSCRIDNINDGNTQFSGSRIRELYDISRADELMRYLLTQFEIEGANDVLFDQPLGYSVPFANRMLARNQQNTTGSSPSTTTGVRSSTTRGRHVNSVPDAVPASSTEGVDALFGR